MWWMAAVQEADWKSTAHNSEYITDNITYNQVAREWRCKWSDQDGKKSLQECQRVLEDVVVPALRQVHGLLSVQRIVCGDCKDFKIVCKLGLDGFDDWAAV